MLKNDYPAEDFFLKVHMKDHVWDDMNDTVLDRLKEFEQLLNRDLFKSFNDFLTMENHGKLPNRRYIDLKYVRQASEKIKAGNEDSILKILTDLVCDRKAIIEIITPEK